jgi:hypothetical protein
MKEISSCYCLTAESGELTHDIDLGRYLLQRVLIAADRAPTT